MQTLNKKKTEETQRCKYVVTIVDKQGNMEDAIEGDQEQGIFKRYGRQEKKKNLGT